MQNRRTVLKGLAGGTVLLAAGSAAVTGDNHDANGGENATEDSEDEASGQEDAGEHAEDQARLRVAHGSPDAPAVDVLVDGDAVVEGLEFRGVTDYLEVPAGEYTVEVQLSEDGATVFGPVDVELAAADYTAVALGEATCDDTEFTVSLFEDTNDEDVGDDEARVRAIHASPDAPAVDVTVDDGSLTLFEDLEFGDASDYTVVPAGSYQVEVRPADGCETVFETDVSVEGGTTYTVFAVGYVDPANAPTDEAFGLVPAADATAQSHDEGGDSEE